MSTWTNRGKLRLADGTFAPSNLTMALLTAIPTDATARDWNLDTDLVAELTTSEVASYVRTALGAATVTENDTTDEAEIDYADVDFGTLEAPAITPALEIQAAAVIDITSDEVMWLQTLTPAIIPNGQNYTVVVASDGLAAVDDA